MMGPISEVYNEDCIELMKRYPDKHFDLAVVDPPYGIGEDGAKNHSRSKIAKAKEYTPKDWDKEPPTLEYFYELFRVSKEQIIWGANHFISRMPYDSSCWIIWDKENGENDFADCEMAWTSFDTAVRKFKFRWAGMLQGNMKDKEIRVHPTQKPVALYDWIYHNYCKQSIRCGAKHTSEYDWLCNICKHPYKILDTHLGSGSSRIAAHKAGLSFVACEIDKEYFDKQEKRFKEYVSQLTLF
jgi:site-specific DNA-methyltransferase (adenine-specific)